MTTGYVSNNFHQEIIYKAVTTEYVTINVYSAVTIGYNGSWAGEMARGLAKWLVGRRNGSWAGEMARGPAKWLVGRQNGSWAGEMARGPAKWLVGRRNRDVVYRALTIESTIVY